MSQRDPSHVFDNPTSKDEPRVILHVDMDCFYAACERLRHPELEGESIVVGMGYQEGETSGVVATASYEARDHGVNSTDPVEVAVEQLPPVSFNPDTEPAGHYFPVDMDYYKSVSSDVKEILHDEGETVREVSVDEAYLDASECVDWNEVEEYAATLKQRIEDEVGIVASIGVAPNMSAAKVASDHDKPDGLCIVRPGGVQEFFAPLDLEEVHEIGPETAKELRELGIETAGDLAEANLDLLRERYGKRGEKIYRYARGEDAREVTLSDPPKSFLRDSAFDDPTDDVERQREQIKTLAHGVAQRAQEHGAMYQTIGIKVVTPPFDISRRSDSLSGPVDDPDLVERAALELLEEFQGQEIRKIGVFVRNLDYSDQEQADLGSWGSKSEGAEKSSDTTDKSQTSETEVETQSSLTDF